MKTSTLALLMSAALISPALAQPPAAAPAPLEHDGSKIQGGAYVVEPNHTRVMFSILHLGFTTFYGQFSKASGTLNLDPKNPAASTFDITVPTETVSTNNTRLDGELRDKPWMDAAAYPTIEFKSTAVKKTGANTADVTGDFTFHGVTKPLTLQVKFIAAGPNPLSRKYTAGFGLTGHLKRSEWGMSNESPGISDEVELIISGAFEKAPAPK